MKNIFKKMVLVASAAALVFAAFPVTSAFAATTPTPAPKGELTNAKLEMVWARQQKAYERVGKAFTDMDAKIALAQALINKAAAKGKDVSAVQSALNAFEASVKNTSPIYDGMKSIVTAHQGFDVNGKVTDAEKAKSTVQALGTKLKEARTSMNGTGKALLEAIRNFRKANKPVGPGA